MRNVLFTLLLSVVARPLLAQGAPPQVAPDQPYTVEYYYKTQWGHQQEFLQLFLKNHYPLLQKVVESGRMIAVRIEEPANHMTEDARWDYRVTIRFKNSTMATTANPDEDRLIKQLWPDQETYKREEQRAVRDFTGPLGSSGDGYHTLEKIAQRRASELPARRACKTRPDRSSIARARHVQACTIRGRIAIGFGMPVSLFIKR
jgi:hypothetical protein